MGKTVGKGTTFKFGGTAMGAGLLISAQPFKRTINTDDITAIDSAAEERGGSLPSWGPARVRFYWDISDAVQDALKAAGETTETAVIITRPDGSTQTATCIVTDLDCEEHTRRGRVVGTAELTPIGAVTLADV